MSASERYCRPCRGYKIPNRKRFGMREEGALGPCLSIESLCEDLRERWRDLLELCRRGVGRSQTDESGRERVKSGKGMRMISINAMNPYYIFISIIYHEQNNPSASAPLHRHGRLYPLYRARSLLPGLGLWLLSLSPWLNVYQLGSQHYFHWGRQPPRRQLAKFVGGYRAPPIPLLACGRKVRYCLW